MLTPLPTVPYPVPALAVPRVWASLQAGFKVVQRKAANDLDPTTIREHLTAQRAFLFLIPEGFFILQPQQRDLPCVLIWVAYARGQGMIARYLPDIEKLARQIGAQCLVFESDRPGYRRVFHDWQRIGRQYLRRLS